MSLLFTDVEFCIEAHRKKHCGSRRFVLNKQYKDLLLLRAEGKTLKEIGIIFERSAERIRQMESCMLRICRSYFRQEGVM